MLDLIIKNVRVVQPHHHTLETLDLGIQDGKFAEIAPHIDAERAKQVMDAQNLLGFPGLVDPHVHFGIYRPFDEDGRSESSAAAAGGVTTCINYLRTGRHYLNRGGLWRDYFPDVLALLADRVYVDYAFHLAPMSRHHIEEMAFLNTEFGIVSFKNFMFYGGHSPHGRSSAQNEFLMLDPDERYDFAHLEMIMRELARLAREKPALADVFSLSLHCEVADLLAAYTRLYERASENLTPLAAYSHAHPPHNEGLAVAIAAYLAHETGCKNINLLHLSSRKAVEAGLKMQGIFPELNIGLEVLLLHLLLDTESPAQARAKVNPPVRPREDVDFLWQAILDRKIHWLGTDHANCPADLKTDPLQPENIWLAKAGYGSIEYLLSGVFSEGSKRGMAYSHMAELLCWAPARRFGLFGKGDIAVGYDADLALLDPYKTFVIRAEDSHSAQGYTPFEGMELTGKVRYTFLHGSLIYENGNIVGTPQGKYLRRPYPQSETA